MTMKPGWELNILTAKAMGQTDFTHPSFKWTEETFEDGDDYEGFFCPRCGASEDNKGPCVKNYSVDWWAAGQAWEWLQKEVETNPPKGWKRVDGQVYLLALADYDGPAVMLIQDTDFDLPLYWEREPEYPYNWYIPGETYPHAIALAVVEAAKAKVPDKAT